MIFPEDGSTVSDALFFAGACAVFCTIVFWLVAYFGRDREIKKLVLGRLLALLRPGARYSPGAEHAFGFDHLIDEGLLGNYDRVDTREDSMEFEVSERGQLLRVRGFELQTSRRHRRKNGGYEWVTADRCYLLRGEYPETRFELPVSILIATDFANSAVVKIVLFIVVFTAVLTTVPALLTELSQSLPVWIVAATTLATAGFAWWGICFWQNRHRARMENIDFEKYFDVRCRDQVLARMVVTPALMERFTRFRERTTGAYEVLFMGREVYVKKHLTGGYLEVSPYRDPRRDLTDFVRAYAELREAVALIADTGLLAFSRTSAAPPPPASTIG